MCNPARYSFMTGLHAGSTRIIDNGDNALPKNQTGVASTLKAAGYTTAMAGKWSLGGERSPGHPLKQGFDEFFGYAGQMEAHNYFPEKLTRNYRQVRLTGNKESQTPLIAKDRVTYAPGVIQAYAVDFITRNRGQTFYLQYHLNLPHLNNERLKETGNGAEHSGASRYRNADWSPAEQDYAEMVSLIDDYTGELVQTLKTHGLEGNTIVFFTSDNGPTGERTAASLDRFHATAGLKGMKGMLFEGGIRVPLIVWGPGRVPENQLRNEVTTSWDMLATFADLAGTEVKAKSDGMSFASLLTAQGDANFPSERILFWEVYDRMAIRRGDWKWVRHPVKNSSKQDYLFDLSVDPGEKRDLAKERPDILKELLSLRAQLINDDPSG